MTKLTDALDAPLTLRNWSVLSAQRLAKLPRQLDVLDESGLYGQALAAARLEAPGHSILAALERLSNEGDARATYALGTWYLYGHHVPRSSERGLALLQRAAEAHLPEAHHELAVAFETGTDLPVDAQQSMDHAVRGALLGHAASIWHLASHLERGFGCAPMPRLAMSAFRVAHRYGIGGPDDPAEAGPIQRPAQAAVWPPSKRFEEAAAHWRAGAELPARQEVIAEATRGDPWCLYGLGSIFLTERPAGAPDAVRLLSKALHAGVAAAGFQLGVAVSLGTGFTPNETEGAAHFLEAALLGDLESMLQFARCLLNGLGVPRDPSLFGRVLKMYGVISAVLNTGSALTRAT